MTARFVQPAFIFALYAIVFNGDQNYQYFYWSLPAILVGFG